ncbi:50 kDa gamma-zein [Drosophila busckii]|uniref:50 kDa gamma-zein n=1 Tax=Drosophila busckii TaxID=30019 RepID=UPI00083F01EF|nr:50 kDa gamma-zein [Drosophila busckii]
MLNLSRKVNGQQVPAHALIVYGDGIVYGGSACPPNGVQVQPAAAATATRQQQQHRLQTQQRYRPRANARATAKRQQQIGQQPKPQQQQQQQHMRQHNSYGNWPFGGMSQAQANFNGNGHAAVMSPQTHPQVHNYGSMGFASNMGMWPGYVMVPAADPSRPFAFGLGATD